MLVHRITVLAYVVAISLAEDSICRRKSGDQLLDSLSAVQLGVLGSDSKRTKRFPGFNITCIESSLPLNLGSLLGFQILDGGVGCDHVALQSQTRVSSVLALGLGGAKIYGLKMHSSDGNYCKTNDQSSLLDTVSFLVKELGITK